MRKVLIVVDMQVDFVRGSLGTSMAENIVPNIQQLISNYKEIDGDIIFTKDTHLDNYLETQEGKKLPIPHCIIGTPGHDIVELDTTDSLIINKPSFGLINWKDILHFDIESIELCGLCTDICVISNALILKALYPEIPIIVNSNCCAGVTQESHDAALLIMKMCQIDVK